MATPKTERMAKSAGKLGALPIREQSVNMSNALVRGAQGLSLAEKRLVALAIAKTDSVAVRALIAAQRDGWTVRILASEYKEAYEVDARTAYEQLKAGARALLRRTWKAASDGKRGRTVREGNYFAVIEYCEGEGRVEVKFTAEVAPHLLGLRAQFTTYKLKQAGALRSVYAWRLFECLKSWESRKCWRVTVAEFHKAMDAPASLRGDFGNLRMRVIEPAVKELRDKSAMLIAWEAIKSGRKVIELEFRFEIDPQGRLEL
jgi:plasmid replication initiation protein